MVRLSIPEVAITKEQLDEQLMRYRAGATLRVLYDPNRTDDIELEFAEPMRSYVLPLALLATGLALLMYVFVTAARDGAFHCASCGNGRPGIAGLTVSPAVSESRGGRARWRNELGSSWQLALFSRRVCVDNIRGLELLPDRSSQRFAGSAQKQFQRRRA